MTDKELADRLDALDHDLRRAHQSLAGSQDELARRLDVIDMNGYAAILKHFAGWLNEHPDFLRREAAEESRRLQQEMAFRWISDSLHLRVLRRPMLWMLSAVLAGFLLAFGSDLYRLRPGFLSWMYNLVQGRT